MLRKMHKGKEIIVQEIAIPSRTIGRKPPPGRGWRVTWGGVDVTREVVILGHDSAEKVMARAEQVL